MPTTDSTDYPNLFTASTSSLYFSSRTLWKLSCRTLSGSFPTLPVQEHLASIIWENLFWEVSKPNKTDVCLMHLNKTCSSIPSQNVNSGTNRKWLQDTNDSIQLSKYFKWKELKTLQFLASIPYNLECGKDVVITCRIKSLTIKVKPPAKSYGINFPHFIEK